MFVVPNCPICQGVRDWLDEHGIAYDEEDVANSFGALRRMYKMTKQELVPVLVVDGKPLVRPDAKQLDELLAAFSSKLNANSGY